MPLTLAGGGTLTGVAALVLLIVSTATDYWMHYRYSGNFVSQGLWRFCINNKCHAHTLSVAFWDATRALILLAMLSCLAGVVLGLGAFSNRTKNTRVRSAGIALLLSGLFGLFALAIYTGMTLNNFGKRYIEWTFSWSFILGWIATFLTITAGILQICGYKKSTAEAAPQNPIDSRIFLE